MRSAILDFTNAILAGRACSRLRSDAIPSYIVVTPQLVHLAPLAAQNAGAHVQPVFAANGIGSSDRDWLARMCPAVPVVPLRASVRGTSASLLDHGVVVEHLARATRSESFWIQDADCFVTDAAFWETAGLDSQTDYAAGPFLRPAEGARPAFPETFLVRLNRPLLDRFRGEYGITARAEAQPRGRARAIMTDAGYPPGEYLEIRKAYFDTLQEFWIAAEHNGFRFRHLPGADDRVHHVGGTSYLHRTFDDLAHWDWWPLNVHYFHLRLLALPACGRFRERFRALIDFHGGPDDLLARYPDYAKGSRRRQSDLILGLTGAERLYSAGSGQTRPAAPGV